MKTLLVCQPHTEADDVKGRDLLILLLFYDAKRSFGVFF
jgi:hypothetical protein